jgi:hypothetical protein
MLFPELVGEINRRLSIDGPAVGGDARHVELKFKNGLLITFSLLEGDARCALSSVVCFFPAREKALQIFELLLEAHAFGYATQDAVFGIDRQTGKIFLFKTFELDRLDPERLISELDKFALVVQRCTDAIVSGRILEGSPAQVAAPSEAVRQDEVIFR